MTLYINSQKTRLVIFDVDGTLYFQRGIRLVMAIELIAYIFCHPKRWNTVRILKKYRFMRESHLFSSNESIEEQLYRLVANHVGCSEDLIRLTVDEWIMIRPLKYLRWFKSDGIDNFLKDLRSRGISVVTLSDYPSEAKLAALGLSFDANVSSVDPNANALKPNPVGIQMLIAKFEQSPSSTLLIGDRIDKDGQCAIAAGINFFIKKNFRLIHNFEFLKYNQFVVI